MATPPKYFLENRFTPLQDLRSTVSLKTARPRVGTPYYAAEEAETPFEFQVQSLLSEAHAYHHREQFRQALDSYLHLRWLIYNQVDPELPLTKANGNISKSPPPIDAEIFANGLMEVTVDKLRKIPLDVDPSPDRLGDSVRLPETVRREILEVSKTRFSGLYDRSPSPMYSSVESKPVSINVPTAGPRDQRPAPGSDLSRSPFADALQRSNEEIGAGKVEEAKASLREAYTMVPSQNRQARATLSHDLAVLHFRSGDMRSAITESLRSVSLHEGVRDDVGTYESLALLAHIQNQEQQRGVAHTGRRMEQLSRTRNLQLQPDERKGKSQEIWNSNTVALPNLAVEPVAQATETPIRPQILDMALLANAPSINIPGEREIHTADLTDNGVENLKQLYIKRIDSDDLPFLQAQNMHYTVTVAYMLHIYYFVLPMAIGDCQAGMGSFDDAEQEYLGVLEYPYLNRNVEVVKLWSRLAGLYMDRGDSIYRAAKDNQPAYSDAKEWYERIIRTDGAVPETSPLYSHSHFQSMRQRVSPIAASTNASALDENPAISMIIKSAMLKNLMILEGLTFLGMGIYFPPFTFEYLQNQARYFAQQARQIEQHYIQYKSQAENEEFRLEQLEQQVEVAQLTVELEERNRTAALEGIQVAQESVDYAEQQRVNAVQARNDFNDAKWELLALGEAGAWAGVAGSDKNLDYNFAGGRGKFSSSNWDMDKDEFIQKVAFERTLITNQLETDRLLREIASATKYREIARAQLEQAQARKQVTDKRVEIAQLQSKFSEENRDFLSMKEFSAGLWYELALQQRKLMKLYLDMAVEMARYMERAYQLETGRALNMIKLSYGLPESNHMTGAVNLLQDIDSFTLDFVRTQSKRAPIKQMISLAAEFPMALDQFRKTGIAEFETTLEQLDRAYPGFYLRKVRHVEVNLLGVFNIAGAHGTLRNIGVSEYRERNGDIKHLVYPSDNLPLSLYRADRDGLVLQVDPKMLRIFENNGVATMWRMEFPRGTNDFNHEQILDVHLTLYYDGLFDHGLEKKIKGQLPTFGESTAVFSMKLDWPDELFYLRSQGNAEISFTPPMFPYNHEQPTFKGIILNLDGQWKGSPGFELTLHSENTGQSTTLTLDENGTINSSQQDGNVLEEFLQTPIFDHWTISVGPPENQNAPEDGSPDHSWINNLSIILEYTFKYRE
jgi:hypothetical protein